LRINAIDEQIGVVVWHGDKGENAAAFGFDCDQRAATVAEGAFRNPLKFGVYGQGQIVAGDGCGTRQGTYRPAAGIDLDLLETGHPVQIKLVALFKPGFAKVVSPAIVEFLLGILNLDDIRGVDAADIAEQVRGELALRVLAEQTRLDIHAGKAIAMRDEAGDLFIRKTGADRQGLEVLAFLQQLLEALAITRLDVDYFGELVDGGVEVGHLARRDLQRIGRVVARQQYAVAIQDKAAIGRDWYQRDAIFFRAGLIVAVLNDLQPNEAHQQNAEKDQHEAAGKAQPAAETI
jgi:hypothetical protein